MFFHASLRNLLLGFSQLTARHQLKPLTRLCHAGWRTNRLYNTFTVEQSCICVQRNVQHSDEPYVFNCMNFFCSHGRLKCNYWYWIEMSPRIGMIMYRVIFVHLSLKMSESLENLPRQMRLFQDILNN